MKFRYEGLQRVYASITVFLAAAGSAALANNRLWIPAAILLLAAGAMFLRTLWPVCTIENGIVTVRNIRRKSFSTAEVVSVGSRTTLVTVVVVLHLVEDRTCSVWAILRDKSRGDLSMEKFTGKQQELANALSVPIETNSGVVP